MYSTKGVHQQHVNCLINTLVLLLIACDTAFTAIKVVYRLFGNIIQSFSKNGYNYKNILSLTQIHELLY